MTLGAMFGAAASGWLSDTVGRKVLGLLRLQLLAGKQDIPSVVSVTDKHYLFWLSLATTVCRAP